MEIAGALCLEGSDLGKYSCNESSDPMWKPELHHCANCVGNERANISRKRMGPRSMSWKSVHGAVIDYIHPGI